MEVGEEVGVQSKVRVLVLHFDLDGLTEVHRTRLLDIYYRRVRYSNLLMASARDGIRRGKTANLDTVAHVLGFQHDLPDGFHPLIATGNRIRSKSDGLLGRSEADVLLTHGFTANGISKVHNTVGEVWVLESVRQMLPSPEYITYRSGLVP